MPDRPLRVYRLDVTLPPGADQPGWEPPGWDPDDHPWADGAFTWPARRNYLSKTAADARADLLRSYGATVHVAASQPVTFPTDPEPPTTVTDDECPVEIPGQLDLTEQET